MKIANKSKPFRSAKTEIKKIVAQKPIKSNSSAYEIAFIDQDFLLRKSLRPVRLQLELLKAELIQQDENIESTVVIFGSARVKEIAAAKKQLTLARQALKAFPNNPDQISRVKAAENMLKNTHYYDQARKLAFIISKACQRNHKRSFVVVTGGGAGIMEAANRGAYDANAKSIGHTIVLPTEDIPNPYISPELCFQFHYFAIRKMHFLIRAKAAVFFPGGFGTLDELFETLTLLQTKKIKPIPILLFGKEYWQQIINFQGLIENGMITPEDKMLFQFVETAEEAWHNIADFYDLEKR